LETGLLIPSEVVNRGRNFRVAVHSGAILPTSSVPTVGRTISWNTVSQYRVGKYFWPELEVNASYYHGGPNDGKNQTFLMPGLMVSKIKLTNKPGRRLGLMLEAACRSLLRTSTATTTG
jgi:hypothetical protein